MSWPEYLLRYRHTVIAVLIAVVVLGIQARFQLPVQLFPDTDPPTVTVITEYPGMAAADVDSDLTRLLEEEITGIDGVVRISSSSQMGLSVLRAEFDYDRLAALAAVDVQNAISRIRRDLPAGIGEPQVLEFSTSEKPIITVALYAARQQGLSEVRSLADNEVRERLERVPGVAAVDVFGAHKQELHVAIDRDRLASVGLDMTQVVRALDEWNLSAPGGRIRHGDLEAAVRFDTPLLNAGQAGRITLLADGSRHIRLEDVASVELTTGEARAAYRHDGRTAIAVQILKRSEANTVEVASRVRDVFAEIQRDHPEIHLQIADDDSVFTEKVIVDMTTTIVTAVALTVLIVVLFLGNLQQAAIIALSIPVAFLATFSLMQVAGMDLNMVTMSALILAIGLLVDDGIVILENIHRHLDELGKTPRQAAVEATAEIFSAKLGGTLTTLSVLIPLMFLGGFVGELFTPLALTLAFALAASFVIAVTLIPLLAAFWLRPAQSRTGLMRHLDHWMGQALEVLHGLYQAGLHAGFRRPVITLGLALLLLLVSLAMLRMLGNEMLPRFDSGSFRVIVDLVPGSTLDETVEALLPVESLLVGNPVVTGTSVRAGYEPGGRSLGDRGAMGVNQAEIVVNLLPRTLRDQTQWEIMDEVRQALEQTPGVVLAVPKEMGGTARSSTAAPVIVRVSGAQPAVLDRIGTEMRRHLAGIPGITDLYQDWALDTPEIQVQLDHERVAELGLTGSQVARTVHQAVDGTVATRFRQALRRDLDVVVRYAEPDRRHPEDLLNILLGSPQALVPLREVARLEQRLGPRILTRENGQRTLDVLGFHFGRPLSEVVSDVKMRLAAYNSTENYNVILAGEQDDFEEAQARMQRAMLLAALAVYLLLVVQFRSYKHPFTVMSAIPLQFIGVVAALLVAGKYVSMPALLGIILLVGIVVNNSIILLEFARNRLAEGIGLHAAISEAVTARLRPILMTALSTVAGMLPLAMEMAVGAERFSPIATVIIGGILAATVLTLVIVPLLFVLLERRQASNA